MRHLTSPAFWDGYGKLPKEIRELADNNFALLKKYPHHPSLQLKKIRKYWSVRIGLHYRALAVERMKDGSGFGLEAMRSMIRLKND